MKYSKNKSIIFSAKFFDHSYGLHNAKILEILKKYHLVKNTYKPTTKITESCDILIAQENSCIFKEYSQLFPKTIRILLSYSLHPSDYSNSLTNNEANKYCPGHKNFILTKKQEEEYNYTHYFCLPSILSGQSFIDQGISKDKIIFQSTGIDLEKYKYHPIKKGGKFSVLFVGKRYFRKGAITLLQAWEKLNLKNAELIMIVGENENTPNIVNKLEKKLNNVKIIRKRFNVNRLIDFYINCSVFVLPSLSDGWGMVASEAMACGRPAIVTENCGVKEIMKNEINGYVVKPASINSLADKILYLYKNQSKLENMGKNARRTTEKISWKIFKNKFISAIEKLL